MKKHVMGLLLGMLWLLAGGAALAQDRVTKGDKTVQHTAAATTAPSGSVVNVNEATPEQLEMLPGIGPSRAKAIADHRKAHPFRRVEELTRIKGIGKKTFARLKPMIALSGPTTLTERPSKH